MKPQRRPRVVGIGLIALDIVINLKASGPPHLYAGGTCGNILTILSYLGWQSFPIARFNGDTASRLILDDLRRWKVDVSLATLEPNTSAPIIVHEIREKANGDPYHKFSWFCPDCGAWLPSYRSVTLASAERAIASLNTTNVFFMDRVSPAALSLAEISIKNGALVVFEPSTLGDPKLFLKALKLCHIVKYSNDRSSSFSAVLDKVKDPLLRIETQGRFGLRYEARLPKHSTVGWRELGAFEVNRFRDAAGAGDWLTAGIIHCLGQDGRKGLYSITSGRLEAALQIAQAMASWACRFEGARGGMYEVGRSTFNKSVFNILDKNNNEATRSTKREARAFVGKSTGVCPACH